MSRQVSLLAIRTITWIAYSVVPLALSGITFFLWSISSQISDLNAQVSIIRLVATRNEEDTLYIKQTLREHDKRLIKMEYEHEKE